MKSASERIIFPLDVDSPEAAKRWVALLAEDVGLFKVGLELFVRAGPEIVRFIHGAGPAGVFLDLKLHDIPATVGRAMAGIAELGAAFATVHCGETRRMLEAAVTGAAGRVGVLAVTVLTSVSAADLRAADRQPGSGVELSAIVSRRAAQARAAGCAGVICAGAEAAAIKEKFGRDFVVVTPGIRPGWFAGSQDDQRRITTPAEAIRNGSDYLVIGRPIRDAADPRAAAQRIAAEIESAR